MQTLCNYLLCLDNLTVHKRDEAHITVFSIIEAWLKTKGANDFQADQGIFESRTPDGGGSFTRVTLGSDVSLLTEIRLEEFAKLGQIFVTSISVIKNSSRILVYVSQMVHYTDARIAPTMTDSRCPQVVRHLLETNLSWVLNGSSLPHPVASVYTDEAGGLELAEIINDRSRSIPIVVVSESEKGTVWPYIAERVALDLAGLAYVAKINDKASWGLTQGLDKINSCYMGAIRLYWPVTDASRTGLQADSKVWTASTLMAHDTDSKGEARFRTTLRKIVMGVASVTIEPPPDIAQIHSYIAGQRLRTLEQKADANSDEIRLAKEFFSENQSLKNQLEEIQKKLNEWSSRAQTAEHALHQLTLDDEDDEEIQSSIDNDPPPKAGDTRFYKKVYSTPNHDVFAPVEDCKHTSWQDASKAEKAKKGFSRLFGVDSWKSLQHCGKCTGGGVWKLRW